MESTLVPGHFTSIALFYINLIGRAEIEHYSDMEIQSRNKVKVC